MDVLTKVSPRSYPRLHSAGHRQHTRLLNTDSVAQHDCGQNSAQQIHQHERAVILPVATCILVPLRINPFKSYRSRDAPPV
jgi:hypothetical protein